MLLRFRPLGLIGGQTITYRTIDWNRVCAAMLQSCRDGFEGLLLTGVIQSFEKGQLHEKVRETKPQRTRAAACGYEV